MTSRLPSALLKLSGLLLVACLLASCCPSRSGSPLASGQIVLVTMGDKPVMRAGETGSWSGRNFTVGRVEVYEHLVIVTEPDGTKHCAPPEWFSKVSFK